MEDKTITVKSIKHETDKAWLAILEDNSEVWFPKSQCSMLDNAIKVPGWLAEAKSLSGKWDEQNNMIPTAEAALEALRKAVDEVLKRRAKLGLASVFMKNGKLCWLLPDGTYTYKEPDKRRITKV